jgi:hypothetical protein
LTDAVDLQLIRSSAQLKFDIAAHSQLVSKFDNRRDLTPGQTAVKFDIDQNLTLYHFSALKYNI